MTDSKFEPLSDKEWQDVQKNGIYSLASWNHDTLIATIEQAKAQLTQAQAEAAALGEVVYELKFYDPETEPIGRLVDMAQDVLQDPSPAVARIMAVMEAVRTADLDYIEQGLITLSKRSGASDISDDLICQVRDIRAALKKQGDG